MKEYTVKINGLDHTMMLDEDDANRYRKGGYLVETKKATSEKLGELAGDEDPQEGSEGDGDGTEGSGDAKKAAKPSNKAAKPSNKAG